MVSEWSEKSLVDLCSIIKRGIGPKYIEEGGVLVINQRCIRDQRVSLSEARRNDPEKKKIPEDRFVQPGDVLINSTGVGTLGRVAQVKDVENPTTVDSHVTIARLDDETVDSTFFGWSFKYLQPVIEELGEGSTGQTELSRHRIGELNISIPPLPEQKAIAHVLGSLDEKIVLNRRMNETLEGMAQALFKSWFVDFDPVIDNALTAGNPIPEPLAQRAETRRQAIANGTANRESAQAFPASFRFTEELGWIPEGWEESTLGKHLEIKRGGSPRPIHDFLAPEGLPWVKIADATSSSSRFLFGTKEFIKPEGLKKTILLDKGSLILSNSATPGLPMFLELDACIHDGWLHFPKISQFTKNYLYQLFLIIREELVRHGSGSVFTNLKTDILKEWKVTVPSNEILETFDNWMETNLVKLRTINYQSQTLAKLRDVLLPKLISGELRIPQAEKMVEDAVA